MPQSAAAVSHSWHHPEPLRSRLIARQCGLPYCVRHGVAGSSMFFRGHRGSLTGLEAVSALVARLLLIRAYCDLARSVVCMWPELITFKSCVEGVANGQLATLGVARNFGCELSLSKCKSKCTRPRQV